MWVHMRHETELTQHEMMTSHYTICMLCLKTWDRRMYSRCEPTYLWAIKRCTVTRSLPSPWLPSATIGVPRAHGELVVSGSESNHSQKYERVRAQTWGTTGCCAILGLLHWLQFLLVRVQRKRWCLVKTLVLCMNPMIRRAPKMAWLIRYFQSDTFSFISCISLVLLGISVLCHKIFDVWSFDSEIYSLP